jgi:hypothetical protein
MSLVWKSPRKPRTVAELSDADQAQLWVVSKLYFGEERQIGTLLPGGGDDEEHELYDLTVIAIEEDGVHAYDEWTYMADSGTFFRAGTTEVVGEIIQCGFESHQETPAGERFAAAYRAHHGKK